MYKKPYNIEELKHARQEPIFKIFELISSTTPAVLAVFQYCTKYIRNTVQYSFLNDSNSTFSKKKSQNRK